MGRVEVHGAPLELRPELFPGSLPGFLMQTPGKAREEIREIFPETQML